MNYDEVKGCCCATLESITSFVRDSVRLPLRSSSFGSTEPRHTSLGVLSSHERSDIELPIRGGWYLFFERGPSALGDGGTVVCRPKLYSQPGINHSGILAAIARLASTTAEY